MTEFSIHGREIGPSSQPYVIAEMSGNHNGSLDRAIEIVRAAAAAGASAIKLQTYRPDTITLDCKREEFLITDRASLWRGRYLYDLYEQAHTPWEWHPAIFDEARRLGIACFSSPFDESAVDFLEGLGVPAYKIASFEIVHLPLIRRVARTGKPMIISTGLASIGEIEQAVATAREEGNEQLVLLKCTSAYPARPEDCNLSTIVDLRERLGTQVGFSDHTLGVDVSFQAVRYYGATVIEKHVTLANTQGGVDEEFSLGPSELADLVAACNDGWKRSAPASENLYSPANGKPTYGATEQEVASHMFRPSIWFTRELSAGHTVTPGDIIVRRPGNGLPPARFDSLVGRQLRSAVEFGTPTAEDCFAGLSPA